MTELHVAFFKQIETIFTVFPIFSIFSRLFAFACVIEILHFSHCIYLYRRISLKKISYFSPLFLGISNYSQASYTLALYNPP